MRPEKENKNPNFTTLKWDSSSKVYRLSHAYFLHGETVRINTGNCCFSLKELLIQFLNNFIGKFPWLRLFNLITPPPPPPHFLWASLSWFIYIFQCLSLMTLWIKLVNYSSIKSSMMQVTYCGTKCKQHNYTK